MNPEEVLNELQKRIDQDAMLGAIRDRIADGKATDLDSARYCIRSGTVAGKYLGSQILDVPSDAREALCVDVLHGRYKDAVKQCAAVQKAQDAKQGLHLAPQIPAFNAERAHKIGRATADPTAEDETIRRRADAPIANATASVHDDFVRKQADFRSGAGLSCWLTRDSGSGCCPWCAEIAGRYAYGSEPKDIYARHDNCACTVTFESGRKRGGRSGRQIEHPAPDAGAGEPVRFTAENAPQGAGEPVTLTAAEAARIQAENGLTKPAGSGRIEEEPFFGLFRGIIGAAPFGSRRSSEEENAETEARLRAIGFARIDSSFFKNIDKKLQQQIVEQLESLERTFGAVSKSIHPSISADGETRAVAVTKRNTLNSSKQKLVLSARRFRNYEEHIRKRREEMHNSHCMPCTDSNETLARYVITHEYGHMLSNILAYSDSNSGSRTRDEIISEYRKQIESIASEIDPAYSTKQSLSKYGGQSDSEFFAECFANSQLGQPNILGNAMLIWLERRGFNVY